MTAPLLRATRQAEVQLAPNPGLMTLDGTNSYVLREPGTASCIVVDPGPQDDGHLAALAAHGPVELILITHEHIDHTAGAARLAALTDAPVRAPSEADCVGGPVLQDGEEIRAAGLLVRVLATPGHTADSVCFHLPDDQPLATVPGPRRGSILTGDTVLGAGSTVIGIPDGTLAEYLDSLDRIAAVGMTTGLPAHGPTIDDLPGLCRQYREHRLERLAQVRQLLTTDNLPPDPASEDVVMRVLGAVYPEVPDRIRFAAVCSIVAQLTYLRDEAI